MTVRETTQVEGQAVIDLAALDRHAMHDQSIKREVLSLFLDQSLAVLRSVRDAPSPDLRSDAAHRLRGAALAVGAVQVAEAAGRVERLTQAATPGATMEALATLHATLAEARAVIAGLLDGGQATGL